MKKQNPKIKGFTNEQIVARYLMQKGWVILHQNKKVFGVEIDILAKKGKEHFLIEVKSITKKEHLENILKEKQKERLQKAAKSLSEDFPEGLRLFLATVSPANAVDFFEIA